MGPYYRFLDGGGGGRLSAPMAVLFVDRLRLNHEENPTKRDVW